MNPELSLISPKSGELLRTQSVLAEFGISDRTEELCDELWAKVQALSELSVPPRPCPARASSDVPADYVSE